MGKLRAQFPAEDLLDELKHETFLLAYMQRWRFIQAYGGMIDARRSRITGDGVVDERDSESLAETEELLHTITTALDQLKRVGRVTPGTLTEQQAALESSAPTAAAFIAELRRITANMDQAASTVDASQVQLLAEDMAKDLAETRAALQARIAKQEDAAYRQAALPSDAEAKRFLRHGRDAFGRVRRAADAIERRWRPARAVHRPKGKTA